MSKKNSKQKHKTNKNYKKSTLMKVNNNSLNNKSRIINKKTTKKNKTTMKMKDRIIDRINN